MEPGRLVDPAAPLEWPTEVAAFIEGVAAQAEALAGCDPDRPSYEMSLGPDADHEVELSFRELLRPYLVPLFQATRLLPHEQESVQRDGLLVLTVEHRETRFSAVVERYGSEIDVEALAALRADGPLTSAVQRSGRLGMIFGVTPLATSFEEAGWGLGVLLAYWGGEAINFIGRRAKDTQTALITLTALSTPVIVEAAVHANGLNTYRKLWKVFAGQAHGWPGSWHEFHIRESVPPDRVTDLITPDSPRWPPITDY